MYKYKVNIRTFVFKSIFPFFLSIISILISSFSLLQVSEANKLSKEANDYARNANKVAEQGNVIQDKIMTLVDIENENNRLSRSKEFADRSLGELEKYTETMKDIQINSQVKNNDELLTVVDIFEDLGSSFCRQIIDKETINLKFYYTLNAVCNNNQIYSFYGGYKNATALLCYEFFPESKFAQTVKINTLSFCKALTHQ